MDKYIRFKRETEIMCVKFESYERSAKSFHINGYNVEYHDFGILEHEIIEFLKHDTNFVDFSDLV